MNISDEVLRNLRKIIRAIDLYSKKMVNNYGLTGSQALLMRELLVASEQLSVSVLSQRISLSHATVTDILNRLHSKGLVQRERDVKDKRRIMVELSEKGKSLISAVPSLLQEDFLSRFGNLKEWEQMSILANLQRVASLMDAHNLDASPVLTSESIGASV